MSTEFTPQQIDEWRLKRDIEGIVGDSQRRWMNSICPGISSLIANPVADLPDGHIGLPDGIGRMAVRHQVA